MEIASLVLEYLRVLIWPGIIAAFCLLFRKHLNRLFSRIATDAEEVSAFGASAKLLRPATIGEQAERLRQESEAILADHQEDTRLETRLLVQVPRPIDSYFLAEELVLRVLEARWGFPLQRQATVDIGDGRVIHSDGAATTERGLVIVEVKLLTQDLLPGAVIDSLAIQAESLQRHLRRPVAAHLAIATTLPPAKIQAAVEAARERAAAFPADIHVEAFQLDELMSSLLGVRVPDS